MQIKNPSGLPTVDYRTVKPLQGNLKDLTQENYLKLKRVLERDGFEVPLFVWRSGEDLVLDLFGGSGSTLVACEKAGRTCYTMELDPKYADVIRKRYWLERNGEQEGWEEGTPALTGAEQVSDG